jgi:hypothetical protein
MKLGARMGVTRLEKRKKARLEKQKLREQKEAADREKRFESGLHCDSKCVKNGIQFRWCFQDLTKPNHFIPVGRRFYQWNCRNCKEL